MQNEDEMTLETQNEDEKPPNEDDLKDDLNEEV